MKIAVCIPCYNEALCIGKVVDDFKQELPDAEIYVIDNNSEDHSGEIASKAGAILIKENNQGKGNVVRTIFRLINADVYVMVDGDDTYPANAVNELIKPVVEEKVDMVIGDRLSNKTYQKSNKRKFHEFGNNLVKHLINMLFKSSINDVLSGYRAFSQLFVKTMPVMSKGFEIETEMTIHALDKNFKLREIPIEYKNRKKGSVSKLSTFKDGFKVLKTIILVFKNYKPMVFFGYLSFMLFSLAVMTGILPVMEYITERYVYRVPMFILSVGLALASLLMFSCGLILDTVVQYNKERYETYIIDYIQK